MKKDIKIIRVNASFEQGKNLFDWLKKYAKHVDEHFVYWDEFAFTVEDLPECDAILIFNSPSKKIQADCFPENVLAFMMEPGVYSEHPWMFKGLNQYSKVYSPVNNAANTILSHGYLGWYLQQDYPSLSSLQVPEKPLSVSCIASDLAKLKGHQARLNFINTLKKELPQIDFFGKGTQFIPDKTAGLLPYRFSIAIENTSTPYYFTEKINDCFLTYTVPLYYGCKNIGKYFPENSFIPINIEEPAKAIEQVRQAIEKDDWHNRIGALQEARELVLNNYQPLAGAAAILREQHPAVKRAITLKPVPPTLANRLKKILRGE
jgi:hypothetical protein